MTDYQAPLTDIRFLLHHVAGFETVQALPGFEDATPDLADAVLKEAANFCSGVLAPLNRVGDREGCRLENGGVTTPSGWKDAYQKYCEGGWVGLSLPTEYGGQALPKLIATPVWEMIHASNLAFSLGPQLTVGQTAALELAASDEIKARFLPRIVSGEWSCTMCLTEPQAGSDLAAIRTRAEPQADGSYRLFGHKIFITYGDHDLTDNIIHLVLARLPDAPPGVKGISMFIVPKVLDGGQRNDVVCTGIEHKLGIHGSPTCAMTFGEGAGAIGWLVGQVNRGLEYMFIMMNEARFGVGVQGFALGDRAYQQALAFAQTRVQGRNAVTGEQGQAIVHHPDVLRTLLTMRARIMAGRSMAYTAAAWFDIAHQSSDTAQAEKARRYLDLLMPVVKGWCTEMGQKVCYDAIQIHGGMGFVEETGVGQHYRDIRIITIYEGTTGIQANDLIGRKILREKGATLTELIADMALDAQAPSENTRLEALKQRLAQDCETLREVLARVLALGPDHLGAVLAVASPFLNLLGQVCATWQWVRMAQAASTEAVRTQWGSAYCDSLMSMAQFYCQNLAPETDQWQRVVMNSGDSVLKAGGDFLKSVH